MSDDAAVRVKGLVKAYGGRRVVDGLDLEVAAGEIVGLIGANGAGKTTTVECVQGLRRPDRGTISVFGLDPRADSDRLRRLVGSQLQSAGLPDRLRVGEAVRLFGGREGQDLLERFGLDARRRSPFAGLSGGERQRLFLVLALVSHPRLVILDELTQGLDPASRRGVWAAIGGLRTQGTTVLLVTHELDEAEALCDRVVAMRDGRVLDAGTPAQLVDRHGRSATIMFTIPAGLPAGSLEQLPGVASVVVEAGRATVTGARAAIAEVGALLVHTGDIPGDLSVRVPGLEDALVELLEGATPIGAADRRELIGAL
ncbi:MAG TPA: ABC transporter ATP-binding protein [Acidimicrobiales bacterium]|nr:ABC transporter ATP-binding protein [Acidimicrobiales bacterium]